MTRAGSRTLLYLLLVTACLAPRPAAGETTRAKAPAGTKAGLPAKNEPVPVYPLMAGVGKKIPLAGGYSLVYGFDKAPKLGTVIMKVQIRTAAGQKDTSFTVKADAGMPAMKGAHDSGDRSFALSRKGDYLLPIDIVMPGVWEIRLSVLRKGTVIFRGRHELKI